MNAPTSPQERRPFARRRWLLLLVLLPLVAGLIAIAAFAFREYRSSREVAAESARLQAAGDPVDNGTMARWFQAGSSQEGTAAWREILVTAEHVTSGEAVGSFPIVGTGKMPEPLVAGGDWPDEPRIAEFLQDVRPLIANIERAGQYSTPAWQPVAFNGIASLLPEIQASRVVVRLLQLEVQYALYHRDTERALRGLAAMRATVAAFDWDFCIVTDLVSLALRGIHRDAIRQSLAETGWEPAQLKQLRAQVEHPRDVAARWPRVLAGERAMVLAWLLGHPEDMDGYWPRQSNVGIPAALWLIPSGTKRYLNEMAAQQELGKEGILGLADRARQLENTLPRPGQQFDEMLTALFAPASATLAAAYERDELDRRLTRTVLGVQSYRLSEGHWPARLSDLAKVGLEPKDWTALQAGPFGYKVVGETAIVWAYDVNDSDSPSRVRSEPPEAKAVASSVPSWHVTRIGPGHPDGM